MPYAGTKALSARERSCVCKEVCLLAESSVRQLPRHRRQLHKLRLPGGVCGLLRDELHTHLRLVLYLAERESSVLDGGGFFLQLYAGQRGGRSLWQRGRSRRDGARGRHSARTRGRGILPHAPRRRLRRRGYTRRGADRRCLCKTSVNLYERLREVYQDSRRAL